MGMITVLSTVPAAAAGECPSWLPAQLCGTGGKFWDLQAIVRTVLYLLIAAAILWSLWNIIQAGLKYSGAGDDSEKKKKAAQKIIAALIGLIIVVVSFTILTLVGGWFGAKQPAQVGIPCVADDKRDGAKDNITQVGVLLKRTTSNDFGCKTDTQGFVCVDTSQDPPQSIDCTPTLW